MFVTELYRKDWTNRFEILQEDWVVLSIGWKLFLITLGCTIRVGFRQKLFVYAISQWQNNILTWFLYHIIFIQRPLVWIIISSVSLGWLSYLKKSLWIHFQWPNNIFTWFLNHVFHTNALRAINKIFNYIEWLECPIQNKFSNVFFCFSHHVIIPSS